MNNEEKQLYELIRNLTKGLKRHGVRRVIKALKQMKIDNEEDVTFSIVDFIENAVCSKIGVPNDELFSFTSRGEITIARKFCMLLIRKFAPNISAEELGNHFNRSRQIVHTTEKEFRLLKSGKQNKFHIDFIAIYKDLEAETELFISSLKKV